MGKIVLRGGAVPGRSFVREHLEGGAEGVHGLFQALGAALPLTQGPKGIAEVVLGRSPIERHALAGTFLKGGAEGVHSLLKRSVPFSRSPRAPRALPRLFWVVAQLSGTRSRVYSSRAAR